VRANIRYGCQEADHERIVEAARLACADGFIRELPQGYDTIVGEQGSRLSGGEKQRLSLARALVRDPDLLILDEATNALDVLIERAFHDAIAQFARERTMVMVAHRMTMMSRTDHIVVLERGRVAEQGPFRTLLRTNGPFARLYQESSLDALHALPSEPEKASHVAR
jgi:subfamily B ATP-binding cassette protein MsbA